MYCPSCRAEYKEGITVCKDCETTLVAELPPPESDPGATLVQVACFKLASDAHMLEEMLNDNGIEASVQGDADVVTAPSGFCEVSVWVDVRDQEKAEEIFQEFFDAEVEAPEDGDEDEDDDENDADDAEEEVKQGEE